MTSAKSIGLCECQKPKQKNAAARPSARLSLCCPGNTTGAPWNSRNLYLPASLPNAMTEPVNVIAPMKAPSASSMRFPPGSAPPFSAMPKAHGSATAAIAMNTAARPIMLCMNATISGILVISTLNAIVVPTAAPTSKPTSTQAMPPVAAWGARRYISATVVTIAIAMPIMPNALPRRDVLGCDRPFSAWMKNTEATRYSRMTTFMLSVMARP